jgi:hypothetical protein
MPRSPSCSTHIACQQILFLVLKQHRKQLKSWICFAVAMCLEQTTIQTYICYTTDRGFSKNLRIKVGDNIITESRVRSLIVKGNFYGTFLEIILLTNKDQYDFTSEIWPEN